MSDTAKNLADAMQAADNISQYALEEKSGVPQPTIGRILSGESENPKIKTIKKLAQALGVSTGFLIDGRQDIKLFTYKESTNPHNSSGRDTIHNNSPIRESESSGFLSEMNSVSLLRVPIVGDTLAGIKDDLMQQPQQYLDTPVRDAGAYGLTVSNGMGPSMKAGSALLVFPNTKPDPGDDVILWSGDGNIKVCCFVSLKNGSAVLDNPIDNEREIVKLIAGEIEIHLIAAVYSASAIKSAE